MTDAPRFTPAEWADLVGAPLLAAMAAIASGGRAGLRETAAVVRSYSAARGRYEGDLMRELLRRSPAAAIRRPADRAAVRGEAHAALRRAADTLERGATTTERSEYRRFVLDLVESAASSSPSAGGRIDEILDDAEVLRVSPGSG